jgi:hypothetical protein
MARQRDTYIGKYEDVADSASSQVLGPTGAIGDYLQGVLIVPEAVGAGTVALLDGTITRNLYVAGTLADLAPMWIPMGIRSVSGAWKISTGASVHCIAVGKFT